MSKRYTLLKADGDGLKSCAFFLSEKGCRNGDDCKFLHGEQPTRGSASAARSDSVLATKAADVAVSTRTTSISSPISSLSPNKGEKAAEGERVVKKAARKSAKKADEKGKTAIKSEAHPAPTPVSTPTPRSPKGEPTPLVSKTEAVPASSSPCIIKADTVVAVEKRAAREKATREVAAHVARVRATAAAAAAKAAAAEAAAAEAEAEAAAVLNVEDPKPKKTRKKKNKNPEAEEAVAAVAPAPVEAISEAAPISTAMAAEAVNIKPKKTRNKKMKEAKPFDVPPAAVAMSTAVPNGIPASAPDNTTTTTTAAAVAIADGVSLPAATPQREISKRKLCSFFNKKKRCRAGDLCPFLHAGVEGEGTRRTRGGINRTQTPKRSEGVPEQNQLQQPSSVAPKSSTVPLPTPIPSTTAVAGSPSVAPPVAPAPVAALSPWPSPVSQEESFQARKKRGRPEASAIPSQVEPVENDASGGLLEGLPISPFVTSDTEDEDRGDTQSEDWLEKKKAFEMEIPHVRADPWQELVDRTRVHPSYAKNYSFNMDSSWVEAHPCGDGCDALPQVVALDCEMSVSEDPVTKERSGKELVRLSIVRGDDGEKLLDTLVHPSNRVVSWLTNIHGVAPKHLKGVSFMHSHAQEAMTRLCCQRTVIIGHALYNDLSVLKMNHARVVDTSLIFERSDSKFSTPSLRDVVKTLFGKDIQSGSHDSVTDSQCTLDAAKFALAAGGAPLPVIERTKRKHSESGERDRRRGKMRRMSSGRGERKTKQVVAETRALMVHRLPLGTTEKQLLHLMEKRTHVVAVKAQPIEFSGSTGKSLVVYKSIAQVDLAFNTLSEAATEEASGRLQKKIFLSKDGKKYISVRHPLLMDEGEGLPLKSSSEPESGSSSNTE